MAGWGRVAVTGTSMLPTLRPGDWLVVRYGAAIRPGDLVVARLPQRPLAVKRAVRPVGERWWVEGDAPASTDSRSLGPVDVVGWVMWRYWPLVRRA